MNKEERQNHILQLIESTNGGNILGTRELAEQFGVSEMTVRRDLQELAEEGLLRRQHGGAAARRWQTDQNEIGILLVSPKGKYSDPFFNAVLEGTDRQLRELGYRISHIHTRTEVSTAQQVQEMLDTHPIKGMILVGPPLGAESLNYLKSKLKSLVGTIDSIGPEYDAVTFDGYGGMYQIVEHLYRLGNRRLGYIAGKLDQRHRGFMAAIADNELPTDPELCVTITFGGEGWTSDLGYEGARRLMALPNPPDAIVCASDLLAIGAIQWLHQNHFRVPEDVAVTGFDNITESSFIAPPITTVHVHKQLLGEIAAERVVKQIENPDEIPLLIQTPTQLVIRQSCGSPHRRTT